MVGKGNAWECECGHIEFGTYPPEECSQCQALESFIRVPEDEIEERVAEDVLTKLPNEEEE